MVALSFEVGITAESYCPSTEPEGQDGNFPDAEGESWGDEGFQCIVGESRLFQVMI